MTNLENFLDTNEISDLEKFLRAIKITDTVYYQGACKWQEYLLKGNLLTFTSKNEARDMMIGVDHENLKQEVIKKILENIISYFRFPVNSTLTNNKAVNYLVDNINYYRKNGVTVETFDIICDHLLKPDFSLDAIEVLKNNIQSVPGAVTINNVNFSVASFLSELLFSKKCEAERIKKPSAEGIEKEIETLKEKILYLESILDNLKSDTSPKI